MGKEYGRGRQNYRGKRKKSRKRKSKSQSQSQSQSRKNSDKYNQEVLSIDYTEVGNIIKSNNKENILNDEDERKLICAKDAWDESLMVFHNPAIPDPKFIFDRSKFIGFFIDLETWQTFMNLSNSPHLILDKEIFQYYHALALHEISHYVICPYDTITNAKLIRSAMKHVPERLSPAIVNFFADLLVDMKLYQKKPKVMEYELRQSLKMNEKVGKNEQTQEHSKYWKILVKCYEKMWDINLDLPENVFKDVEVISNKITKLMLKDFEDITTWEKKVNVIARLLKDLMNEEFPPMGAPQQGRSGKDSNQNNNLDSGSGTSQGDSSDDKNSNTDSSEGNKSNNSEDKEEEENGSGGGKSAGGIDQEEYKNQIPLDVQQTMGNPLEIKGRTSQKNSENKDENSRIEEDRTAAEELAQEMSLDEFIKVNRIMGLVDKKDAIATYYRGISKDLLKIKMYERKPSGSIPVGIETWRVGDSIDKLDILQSILVSPRVIPNLTTRKWIYKDGPGIDMNLQIPDLLLVIDSSGSMSWEPYSKAKNPKNPYHLALTASFAALHYALKKGSKIASINFSEAFFSQDWTNEYRKIEKNLLYYMGYGTVLPMKEVKKMCMKADRKCLVMLITDFEISNWGYAFSEMLEILDMGHRIIGFFIGGSTNELQNDVFAELSERGAKFYPITHVQDLIGLVIKEVKENFQ